MLKVIKIIFILLLTIFLLTASCASTDYYVKIILENNDYESKYPEYGEPNDKNDIILYQTRTFLYRGPWNEFILYRYYIRDIEGTYNKKIFEILCTSDFRGGSYYTILGNKYIWIFDVNENQEDLVFDLKGNIVNFDKQALEYNRYTYYSPKSTYKCVIGYDFYVRNSDPLYKHGQLKIFDPNDNMIFNHQFKCRMTCVLFAGWTADERYLYFFRGIYEFTAAAELWRIDLKTKAVYEYKSLADKRYPVYVYPDEDLTFVSDEKIYNYDELPVVSDINIYKLDLSEDKITTIHTEKNIYYIYGLYYLNKNLYYATAGESIHSLMELNESNKTRELFSAGKYIFIRGKSEKNKQLLFSIDNEYMLLDINNYSTKSLGTGISHPQMLEADKKEYISDIDIIER